MPGWCYVGFVCCFPWARSNPALEQPSSVGPLFPEAYPACCARLHLQSDKAFLVALKAAQQGARLADDEASSLVKEAARARVEGLLDAAVKCIRQRSRVRDYTGAVGAATA